MVTAVENIFKGWNDSAWQGPGKSCNREVGKVSRLGFKVIWHVEYDIICRNSPLFLSVNDFIETEKRLLEQNRPEAVGILWYVASSKKI